MDHSQRSPHPRAPHGVHAFQPRYGWMTKGIKDITLSVKSPIFSSSSNEIERQDLSAASICPSLERHVLPIHSHLCLFLQLDPISLVILGK